MTISKKCKNYKLIKTKKNKKHYGGTSNANQDFNVEGGKKIKNDKKEDDNDSSPPGVITEISDGIRNSTTPVLSSLAKSIATGANAFADNLKIDESNKNGSKKEEKKEIPGVLGLGFQAAQNAAVSVIDKVNDTIKDNKNQETVIGAVARTAEIGKDIIEKSVDVVDKTLNSQKMRDKIEETSEIAAEVVNKVVDNLDEPLEKFADKIGEAGADATSGVTSGIIKVVTDGAAAVPGVGAAVELGKIANDATSSAASVVEAAKNSVNAFTELTNDVTNLTRLNKLSNLKKLNKKGGEYTINDNNEYDDDDNDYDNDNNDDDNDYDTNSLVGGKKIQNYKRYIDEKNKIIRRTNNSIKEFIKPKPKTNKRLLKRKIKSKKVRFSL